MLVRHKSLKVRKSERGRERDKDFIMVSGYFLTFILAPGIVETQSYLNGDIVSYMLTLSNSAIDCLPSLVATPGTSIISNQGPYS